MTLNKTTKNLVPVLLILAFTGFFTGKTPYYVRGLSPFFSDMGRVEAVVFSEAKNSRFVQEQVYEDRVKNRILKVISRYYTGLDEENDSRIPNGYSLRVKNMDTILFF